jgi:hypothetical protein
MRPHIRHWPSPALIISLVALFVALGGTGYAITVTGKTVKNNSLTGRDVKNNSLTSKDIRDRSLRVRDFLPGELPGTGGGAPGRTGAAGSALAFAHVNGNGTVDAGASKNIAVVKKTGSGAYCLNYTAGTATNIVLTIDNAGADPSNSRIGGTAVAAVVASACGAGADIVVATSSDPPPVFVDHPFYIAVIG